MANPWTPEYELTLENACKLITAQFPQLSPLHIRFVGKGFDNTVFLVNQEYIFRFPRRTIAVRLLQTENKILPQLSKKLYLPIPEPVFLGTPSPEYPWPFTGYRIVPGVTPNELTDSQRIASAVPFARFLRTLHLYPFDKADVPFDQMNRLSIEARKDKLEENVNSVVNAGLLPNKQTIMEYLANLKMVEVGCERVLVHGDLHFRNILVDHNGMISGIIDWGDIHIGHPAVDLSFVYSFLPPKGRNIFFETYGQVDETTKYLAKFKAVYSSVLLILYAHDQHNQGFVRAALQALQLALSN